MLAIERLWRGIATAFCFALFGIVGATLSLILIPLVIITPNNKTRQHIGKLFLRTCFIVFLWLIQRLSIVTITIENRHRLQQSGVLVLANHPSLIDVIVLIALIKNPDCIIKESLLKNPFMLGMLQFAGFIPNQTGEETIIKAVDSLKKGNNLILFPEGTRTEGTQNLKFKRGAANIALRGPFEITPILISCSQSFLPKNAKWYEPPRIKPQFKIHVCDNIDIKNIINLQTPHPLHSRELTTYLEDYFRKRLFH